MRQNIKLAQQIVEGGYVFGASRLPQARAPAIVVRNIHDLFKCLPVGSRASRYPGVERGQYRLADFRSAHAGGDLARSQGGDADPVITKGFVIALVRGLVVQLPLFADL